MTNDGTQDAPTADAAPHQQAAPAADGGAPAGEPAPETRTERARSAYRRYRVMAFITGAFLILLCIEMLLKYVFQVNGLDPTGGARPVLGDWIAIVHGWIYVVYVVTVFDLWSRMRWSFGRILLLVAGGVVPVLSFVMERRASHWFQQTLDARTDPTR